MNDADASNRIQQMVRFIRQEAEEKGNEISASAEEEFKTEKLQLVEAEKKMIREEYERKEKQLEIRNKIEYSMQLDASRMKILQAQDELVNSIMEAASKELSQITHHHIHKHLLKELIVQRLQRVQEPSLVSRGSEADLHFVDSILPSVKRECSDKERARPPEIVFEQVHLQPAPAHHNAHGPFWYNLKTSNPQFPPIVSQIPITQDVPIPQNISPHLFQAQHPNKTQDVPIPQNIHPHLFQAQHSNKNQKGAKIVWCVKEDVALMSAWISVSEENLHCRNQKGVPMWSRVLKLYHDYQAENPSELKERNIESLRGRWKRLNENAKKWMAACKEASIRKKGGMIDKDVEREAHTIYQAGGSKFQDLVVFNEIMCKHPKWKLSSLQDKSRLGPANEEGNEEESGASSKRSKTCEDVEYSRPSNLETPSTGCSNISRPIVRDKAKKKGKSKVSQSIFTNEVVAEIRALRQSRDNEVELLKSISNAKIELEREKIRAADMKMNQKILNTLLAKDHLSPKEEELKQRLMTKVFGS